MGVDAAGTVAERNNLKVVGHSGYVARYRADFRFELESRWGVESLATTQYSPPIAKLFIDLMTAVEESPK